MINSCVKNFHLSDGMVTRIRNIEEMRRIENCSLGTVKFHFVFTTILKSHRPTKRHLKSGRFPNRS